MTESTPRKCETHSPHVTLKEWVEEKFRALDELRKQEASTLVIQAKEYERRLDTLNHEAKRIDEAANKSVSRDVFDTFLRGDTAWKSQSERDRASHLPRSEYDVQHKALRELISSNTERLVGVESSETGKQKGLGLVGAIILGAFSALSAAAAVAAVILSRH